MINAEQGFGRIEINVDGSFPGGHLFSEENL